MKTFKILLSAAILFIFSKNVFAQAPNAFSYQAVVRNSSNNLVINAPVGVKISILKGSSTGPVAYSETHNINTNSNGLFTLQIGTGTIISGTFVGFEWDSVNGIFFLKTEIDPTGGTNYTISSTSQFLSVPYAKYADKALQANSATVATTATKSEGSVYISKVYNLGPKTQRNVWFEDAANPIVVPKNGTYLIIFQSNTYIAVDGQTPFDDSSDVQITLTNNLGTTNSLYNFSSGNRIAYGTAAGGIYSANATKTIVAYLDQGNILKVRERLNSSAVPPPTFTWYPRNDLTIVRIGD